MKHSFPLAAILLSIAMQYPATAQNQAGSNEIIALESLWNNPPEDSQPWNYWYWMFGAYSKEGITADLEAMKENGIAGSYQFTILGVPDEPLIEPSYRQLTPEWWDIWSYSVHEADRLGRKIAFNTCDGWALAGGPWITPELSMQTITWSEVRVRGGSHVRTALPMPPSQLDYYRDIATFAVPAKTIKGKLLQSSFEIQPKVIDGNGKDISFIAKKGNNKDITAFQIYTMEFQFEDPFTCRSVYVRPRNCNYHAQRMTLEVSDDGEHYRTVKHFEAPRMGWYGQSESGFNWLIPETKAKYYRFTADPEGGEAMDEDMDKPKGFEIFSLFEIGLFPEARIPQYEGKSGSIWRVSPDASSKDIRRSECIKVRDIIDISDHVNENGVLDWDAPKGEWIILRMGCTTNGSMNGPAGGAIGLECDKFNPEAIQLQLDSWIGHLRDIVGADVFSRVVKYIHVDSWECGSQNWSPVFPKQFFERRGYDIKKLLPLFAGIPVRSARFSENVLRDVRRTEAELYADTFARMVRDYAHNIGCEFSAEAMAPATLSENLLHYKYSDFPMGEFWLNSPTQDKPSDIFDATSAAHIYGKRIVGAEAFTETSINWNEYPGMLKSLQDLEFTRGVNRLVFHVNVHNPWMKDHLPGMTLWTYGLFFQRDQTWWKQAKAWMDYTIRCQALLQQGQPVVDLAVWTGDDIPSRCVHPQRMVPLFPEVFGMDKVNAEKERLRGRGLDRDTSAIGVIYTAHTTLNEDWINPMHGYHYDSFNSDALKNLAKVSDGQICLPGGMSYRAIVIPPADIHNPNAVISKESAAAIRRMKRKGIPVISDFPFQYKDFKSLDIKPDFQALDKNEEYVEGISFCHRRTEQEDIYFVANHDMSEKSFDAVFRVEGRVPEIWNPVNGSITKKTSWSKTEDGVRMPLKLQAAESLFIIFRNGNEEHGQGENWQEKTVIKDLDVKWNLDFNTPGIPVQSSIEYPFQNWKDSQQLPIRYFSGSANYRCNFKLKIEENVRYFIDFDNVYNLATVKLNGIDCGTLWTKPYSLDITDAMKQSVSDSDGIECNLDIEVVNTWFNHIKGVNENKVEDKSFWSTVQARKDLPLQDSGLTGRVYICK